MAYLLIADQHHQSSLLQWATMLLAMMPPLLAQPIVYILRSSRTQRRIRALLAFGLGYTVVWMLAGPLLTTVTRLLGVIAGDGVVVGLAITSLAILWSASPWHQTALNRGHRVQKLAAFGWQADLDAISYGLVHGTWCFASCWAWMLVPLATITHHASVMVLVTVIMLIERLAPPSLPKWRVPLPIRLLSTRYVHA